MIKKILKAKTKQQILSDFCKENNIDETYMKYFMCNYSKDKSLKIWIISIILWIIGLSLAITGGIAIHSDYFWFPIKDKNSMLIFINVFWSILWFAISLFIIIYGIQMLVRLYDDGTSSDYYDY
jgi:hypothetical protein